MNAFLGLGSNLGQRETFLWKAIEALAPHLTSLRWSPLYETAPVGVTEQPRFLNMAVQGTYDGDPHELLRLAKRIERDLGRQPRERFGPREIDIDLLLAEDMIVDTADLTLPHPRLAERLFVLRPLVDLAPETIHPVLGASVGTLWESHPDAHSWRESMAIHIPTVRNGDASPWWLGWALRHMQAFALEGALPPDLAAAFIQEARAILRQPAAFKAACRKTDKRGGGYTPPGIEYVARHGVDADREFWDTLAAAHGRNQFPTGSPRFRELSLAVQVRLETLAMACFSQLDEAFGTTLAPDARHGEHMLRTSRYLAKGDPDRVLFPEHYDFGLLTFFGGGAAPGLEGEHGGSWYPMTGLGPGHLLVGAGNTLKTYRTRRPGAPGLAAEGEPLLSRGFHHRVTAANTGEDDRLSFNLFTEPRADVTLPNGQNAGERLQASVERIRPDQR